MKGKIWIKISKWMLILNSLFFVSFLILTFTKSNGFTFWDSWKISSFSSILHDTSNQQIEGAGPLQKHFMQILITLLGGGALGLAGLMLQKITRNTLAEVSILGIGSFNILFIYIYAFSLKSRMWNQSIWSHLMPIFLILVSILGTFFVWVVARSRKTNKNTFVIVGIAFQLLLEAISVIVVNPKVLLQDKTSRITNENQKIWNRIKGYTLGEVKNDLGNTNTNFIDWWLILLVAFLVILILGIIFFIRKKIDTYEISEDLALATGIYVKRLKMLIYFLIAILAGAATAILGSVALLGIIAPSIARLLFKNRMWQASLASFLIGGIMVGGASFIALQLEAQVPVGILSTAIVVPYFLYLMWRGK